MNIVYSYNPDVTNLNTSITTKKNIYAIYEQSYGEDDNINNNNITSQKNIFEYNIGKNMFDPNKSSPPNDFKIHAYMRMNKY
mgnify:CR=1 FL=1